MEFNMYSVMDQMTGKFMNPMFVEKDDHSDVMAIRQFKSNMNSIKLWKDNANDFDLYLVGEFDDEAGAKATPITKICSGRSLIDGSDEI